MARMLFWGLILVPTLFGAAGNSKAQTAQVVEIDARDGQRLVADFYPASRAGAPAVVLLHQLYTNRGSWATFVARLQAKGYAVLSPDLRGYGQTGGEINWQLAQDDTLLWLNWLRQQPNINGGQIALMGSSMGANLAVIGCADDRATKPGLGCTAVVALSPGLNYFGYTPLEPALAEGGAGCYVLFVSSVRDGYPAQAVQELSAAFSQVRPLWVEGNAHGIDLLDEAVSSEIMTWLAADADLRCAN